MMPEASAIHNFRSLGGIRADEGHRIRPAMLYRSGVIMAPDVPMFMELRTVVDLRGPSERAKRSYSWCAARGIRNITCDVEVATADVATLLRRTDAGASAVRTEILALYANLPFLLARAYGDLLKALSDGGLPLLFCCTAGKDRTGVAAMIVLTLLGVRWHDVVTDYAASDVAIGALKRITADHLQLNPDAEHVRPALIADPFYLETSAAAIRERCGSFDVYLSQLLGVSERTRRRIRESLLADTLSMDGEGYDSFRSRLHHDY